MIALKASLLLGVAWSAAILLRNRSAATRHAVLAAAFGCAGALPLVERWAPGWGATASTAIRWSAAAPERGLFEALWAAGAIIGLVMLTAGLWRLARVRSRSCRSDDPRLLAMVDEVSAELAIGRSVGLFESRTSVMPVTWGMFRPLIVLPERARQWPDDRVRAVLRHELAHVRRGDWAVNLLAEAIARAFWFTPIVWVAQRGLRRESERACDDMVMNLGVDGAEYATHLLAVARELRARAPATAMAMARVERVGQLERRITAILSREMNRAPLTTMASLVTAALLAAGTIPIAGFGNPASPIALGNPPLLDVQRDIMMRLGGEERRFNIVSRDVSFWKNRIEGRVELQARLNVDGSVSGVRLVEPVHPDLASAAAVIVRQWRREPARVRGVPVEVPIRMTVDFRR